MLRPYQQDAIESLYAWFRAGNPGHPCLVLPTGAGKSHIIAALCKDALTVWPETKLIMLTHSKELIQQNAQKLLQHWHEAPIGVYSASMGKKQLNMRITFAGIQSIRNQAASIGHVDIVIVDECHIISNKDEGSYRTFLRDLLQINPMLKIIGLTATPYRLGHGTITQAGAIFTDLLEPVSIEKLISDGYLSKLRSKCTTTFIDTSHVHKRGGEFVQAELQNAVDNCDQNNRVVQEIIAMAGDRKAWLCFCTGVKHANRIALLFQENGIESACVTGCTPKRQREQILHDFKQGKIRALTNANVLTTGFDYPDIDLIAMLRPTMSPALYVQMAGRGLRLKSHTDHCLILDFAGVIAMHGPITDVQVINRSGNKKGEPPVKICDFCAELVHPSKKICPACNNPFPPPVAKVMSLHNDDIMGLEGIKKDITAWSWKRHTSQSSGKEMLAVTYYGDLSDRPITEYLPLIHDGYARIKTIQLLKQMAFANNIDLSDAFDLSLSDSLMYIVDKFNNASPPNLIEFKKDGKFYRVLNRVWNGQPADY